jgi:hypothetical protein
MGEGQPLRVEDVGGPASAGERTVVRAGLDEADAAAALLAEARGHHAAGRAAADDDHYVIARGTPDDETLTGATIIRTADRIVSTVMQMAEATHQMQIASSSAISA